MFAAALVEQLCHTGRILTFCVNYRLAPVATPYFMMWRLTIEGPWSTACWCMLEARNIPKLAMHTGPRIFRGGCQRAASKIVGARAIQTSHASSTRMGNATGLWCGMALRSSMSEHSAHPRRRVNSPSGWLNGYGASPTRRWRSGRRRTSARRFSAALQDAGAKHRVAHKSPR
jgi:hypothetical protein